MSSTINTVQPRAQATVSCSVEIYPYEGGSIILQAGSVLACSVSARLRNGEEGRFQIVLTPGGPYGTTGPSWAQAITPMSLVLIGMARGQNANIVMVGVVDNPIESQQWQRNGGTVRVVTITGRDFSYYFKNTNYYTQVFLGQLAGTALGNLLGLGARATPQELNQGFVNTEPSKIARFYYNSVMVATPDSVAGGQTAGLLGRVSLPFQNQRVTLSQAISTYFEHYPYARVPTLVNFNFTEGNWYEKFVTILPWPWYEFYVHTFPINFFASGAAGTQPSSTVGAQPVSQSNGTTVLQEVVVTASVPAYTSGFAFTMQSMPGAPPVGPTLVARINPLPFVVLTPSDLGGTVPFVFGGVDASRWNNLPIFAPNYGFIDSNVLFSTEEVRNFYALNPTSLIGLYGNTANNTVLYYANMFSALDTNSLIRYGYKPQILPTAWLCDKPGQFAQQSAAQNQEPQNVIATTVGTLLTQLFSYHEPSPLMARGSVTMELRPDILIGNRFRYNPFKNDDTWDFYIETIDHSYRFGEESMTTVGLTRGLPTNVYSQTASGGLMQAIHTGNAVRTSGGYITSGNGASGLTLINPLLSSQYAEQNSSLSQAQATAKQN
jgi:hypothetical protein